MSTLIKRSFVGGEIAPAVQARVDTAKYEYGLKACRNFIVMRHGGVQNRPGTKLVGEVFPVMPVDFDGPMGEGIRIIPFIVDSSNAYVLEFRTKTFTTPAMRVIKNGAYIATSISDIISITQANPAVVTTLLPHGLITGREVFISGSVGMPEINNRDLFVTVLSPTTYSLKNQNGTPFDSSSFGAYVFDGKAANIYETTATGLAMDSFLEPRLKYIQSANSMIFTGGYEVRPSSNVGQPIVELKRISDTNWVFSFMTYAPTIQAPTGLAVVPNVNGAPLNNWTYVVTAVSASTGEESLPTAPVNVFAGIPSQISANRVSWNIVAGASEYNVYRMTYNNSNTYGLIAVVTSGLSMDDINILPVATIGPPNFNNPFASSDSVPSCATFFQQRLMLGGSYFLPERIYGSRTGIRNNFGTSRDVNDDDGIQFDMTASQINRVVNMINIGKLVVFTSGSENSIEGDVSGVLTPTAINPKQYSQNGSSIVPPLVVGGNALYIQNRGAIVRDLSFEFQSDSYRGNDLTIFASHLFEGRTIVEWCWQQIPQSIVWCVLDNGTMIALTYIREQQIWAWHRHDTDGLVKHICCIPEQEEDHVYMVVDRTIGGVVHHFTERLNTRIINDAQASDGIFCDSAVTINQSNQNPAGLVDIINSALVVNGDPPGNIIAINSPTWLAGVPLLLRVYGITFPFLPARRYNIRDQIRVTDGNGFELTLTITFLSTITGQFVVVPDRDVPATMQSLVTAPIYLSNFQLLTSTFYGFWHLEGESVSVLADGAVIASPNNSEYPATIVTNGRITLPIPAAIVTVGLPYICDIETLNIDSPQGETAIDKAKSVGRVTVALEESRGGFFGAKAPSGSNALEGMFELKTRNQELYGNTPDLITDYADVNLLTEWNSNGRVFIRQTEPLPISILAIAAGGFFPLRP